MKTSHGTPKYILLLCVNFKKRLLSLKDGTKSRKNKSMNINNIVKLNIYEGRGYKDVY
jgi:hypothetical protein